MKNKIKNFVDGLNKLPLLADSQIVAFQFVSLDNIHDGKMVWWDYLHTRASHKYNYAFKEFTLYSEGSEQIVNTLTNWEYEGGPFWYHEFGDSRIIDNFSNNFNDVSYSFEDMYIERVPANEKEKKELLLKWEDSLGIAFKNKGASIWISIPHRENSGSIIYTSIFCVFNAPLEEEARYVIFRSFRNFIIDYIVDLYRKDDKEVQEILENEIEVDAYKPIYAVRETGKTSDAIGRLSDQFFTSRYVRNFVDAKQKATDHILVLWEKEENKSSDKKQTSIPKLTFSNIDDICNLKNEKLREARFFTHIYGRFMMLALCLIFNKTAKDAFKLIVNSDKQEFKEINNCLKIVGFKDATNYDAIPNNGLDVVQILPGLSQKEKDFLNDICKKTDKTELGGVFK